MFTEEGKMMVTKVGSKTFIGKDIIYVAVFKKKDTRTIYNFIYRDGAKGASYVKRFAVTSITRDKEYDLTKGAKKSKSLYFSANPNGEAELVTILLRQSGGIKKLKFDLDFSDMIVKGRASRGNIVTKYSIKRIELKEKGLSTLKPRKIWFDETVQRLNVDQRGGLLGDFTSEDRLLVINQKGAVKTVVPEMTLHFNDEMIVLEKWETKKPITVIYWEGEKELFYVKRFLIDHPDKEELVITDHPKSYLETVFTDYRPLVELVFAKKRGKDREENSVINLEEFISIKGIAALGNQLTKDKIIEINAKEPLFYESPAETLIEDLEVVEEETLLAETKTDAIPLEPGSNNEKSNTIIDNSDDDKPEPETDDEGQILLF